MEQVDNSQLDFEALLADIRVVPDLLQHLGHMVIKGRYSDGQPVARDPLQAPLRTQPLDEIDKVFAGLWMAEATWRHMLGGSSVDRTNLVRFDENGKVIGPKGLVGTPEGADVLKARAIGLVNRLTSMWPDIVFRLNLSVDAPATFAEIQEWSTKPIRRWPMSARQLVPQKPRTCPAESCGERNVWARLEDGTALCYSCSRTYAREVWESIQSCSKATRIPERTLQRWAAEEAIRVRQTVWGQKVERNECKAEREFRDLRKKVGTVAAA